MTVKAPITETLASALIMLTPWNKDRILVDPFCGSGTFPIEAAMMAADMAPGMNRSFLAEDWKHLVPRKCWYDALEEAQDRVNLDIETDIQGYDIDPEALKAARSNAKMAGVDKLGGKCRWSECTEFIYDGTAAGGTADAATVPAAFPDSTKDRMDLCLRCSKYR